MSENKIKSEKAKALIQKGEYTMYGERVISVGYVTKAISIAENELTEQHAKELQEVKDQFDCDKYHMECNHQIELQEVKDRAVEAFINICPIGHPERLKNVGLKGVEVCPYIDIIGFPCCNDRCPFILSFLTELNK